MPGQTIYWNGGAPTTPTPTAPAQITNSGTGSLSPSTTGTTTTGTTGTGGLLSTATNPSSTPDATGGLSSAIAPPVPQTAVTTENLQAPQMSIAGNIGNYLDPNSSTNQMLKTKALEAANGNGTLNSSMTDSAISNGIIANAQGMAQQDQGAYASGVATNTQAANQSAIQQSQLQSQQNVTQMNNANQIAMTNLNNSNKATLQGSSAAVNIYQQAMNNISTIQNNTSMDQATKDLQVQNIIATTQAALNDQSSIVGLNIGANFNGLGVAAANTTATDTATAAAAAQPVYHYTPHYNGRR